MHHYGAYVLHDRKCPTQAEQKKIEECAQDLGYDSVLHSTCITRSAIFDQYIMNELYALENFCREHLIVGGGIRFGASLA